VRRRQGRRKRHVLPLQHAERRRDDAAPRPQHAVVAAPRDDARRVAVDPRHGPVEAHVDTLRELSRGVGERPVLEDEVVLAARPVFLLVRHLSGTELRRALAVVVRVDGVGDVEAAAPDALPGEVLQ